MMAFQTDRTQAYDEDLRWRMVYQRYALELTYREIATNLNVYPSTVQSGAAIRGERDGDEGPVPERPQPSQPDFN